MIRALWRYARHHLSLGWSVNTMMTILCVLAWAVVVLAVVGGAHCPPAPQCPRAVLPRPYDSR